MRVAEIMTRHPVVVGENDPLSLAGQMMAWLDIRHLPVLHEGRVVGVLSERDLAAGLAAIEDRRRPVLVGEVMSSPARVADPDDPLTEAAQRMVDARIGCLPVVTRGDLVGVLTSTDLLRHYHDGPSFPEEDDQPRVADVLQQSPPTVHPDDSLLDAAARMRSYGVHHLPVVDGEDTLLGILTDRDVRTAVGDPFALVEDPLARLRVRALRVESAMTREVVTTTLDQPVRSLARGLSSLGVGAVPVVDSQHRLVGLVTYPDLLRALAG